MVDVKGVPLTGEDLTPGKEVEVMIIDDSIRPGGKSAIALMTMLAHVAAGGHVVVMSAERASRPIIKPNAETIAEARNLIAVLRRDEEAVLGVGVSASLDISSLQGMTGRSYRRADREDRRPWYRRHERKRPK